MPRVYKRLSYDDRIFIEALVKEGMKPKDIATKVHVHLGTIYKELQRGGKPYSAITAQKKIM